MCEETYIIKASSILGCRQVSIEGAQHIAPCPKTLEACVQSPFLADTRPPSYPPGASRGQAATLVPGSKIRTPVNVACPPWPPRPDTVPWSYKHSNKSLEGGG